MQVYDDMCELMKLNYFSYYIKLSGTLHASALNLLNTVLFPTDFLRHKSVGKLTLIIV